MPAILSGPTLAARHAITSSHPAAPPSQQHRRTQLATWWSIVVSAAVAVSIVTFVEGFTPAVPGVPPAVDDAPPVVSITPPAFVTAIPTTGTSNAAVPRSAAEALGPTAAALAVDGMELRLAAGAATLAVGDSPRIELTTTRIGDLVVADEAAPTVEQRDGEAVHVWPDVTEWYRAVEPGFEHGYTIDRPVHAGDTLTIDVAVAGAEAIGAAGDIVFARDGEAPVWYRGLHVFDATGTTLPATMSATDAGITIEVTTTGAAYPVTVDPIITEDQRIAAPAAGLTILDRPDTATASGTFLDGTGGAPTSASCGAGTAMTGLRVWTSGGLLSALQPECTSIEVTSSGVSLVGPSAPGPEIFNAPQTVDGAGVASCTAGSVVVGFDGQFGLYIDSIALSCVPLLPDGQLGTPTSLPPVGLNNTNAFFGPRDCAGGFADGLVGRAGDAVDSLAFTCSAIAVLDQAEFGSAVAIVGDRMVVSSPRAAVGGVAAAGLVSVYERPDSSSPWALAATIESPVAEVEGFGDAVALSPDGTRLAVGQSHRLAGLTEPGHVSIFELSGGDWAQVGTAVTASTIADAFGASVAWLGNDRIVVGAPEASGGGAVYQYTVGTPSPIALPVAGLVLPGDQLGYSVDADTRPGGGYRIIAGAPGDDANGGAIYLFESSGPGDLPTWRRKFSGYAAGSRTGTSVAVSANRVVFAAIGAGTAGSNLVVQGAATVDGGVNWGGEFAVVSEVLPVTVEDRPNDYIDFVGGNVVVGRPGAGGQVGIFRDTGSGFGPVPDDQLQPAGRQPGDRIGLAVALDGRTLVTGAPGSDSDAGAVYSVEIPAVATFIDEVDFAAWEDPTNWDVGVVPGAADVAIVPFGLYAQVNAATVVDRLVTTGQLRVLDALDVNTRIDIGSFGGIDVATAAPALLGLPPTVTLDGYLEGNARADRATSVSGSGVVTNTGVIEKTGPGVLAVGPGITWTSFPTSALVVSGGDVDVQTTSFVPDGRIEVAAGSEVSFAGDLALTGTSVVEIELDPDAVTTGRISVTGTLTQAGTLVAVNAAGADPSDVYEIFTCGNCTAGLGFTTQTIDALDVVQSGAFITLRTIENKIVSSAPNGRSFGAQIDVDGDRAAVGEPDEGNVYVLERDPGSGRWSIVQTLSGGAGFGRAVTISDSYLVVVADDRMWWYRYGGSSYGSPTTNLVLVPSGVDWAAERTLRVVAGTQVQIFNLATSTVEFFDNPDGLTPSAELGYDVAFGGDVAGGEGYAVVSAPGDDKVVVYEQSGGTWSPAELVLSSPSTSTPARFGESVAMSGSTIVVGEPLNDETEGDAGAVWVYDTPTDVAPQRLEASDADSGNVFGSSVAIDGDTIVVGSAAGSQQGIPYRDGTAYVFDGADGTWVETQVLRAVDGFAGERFGDAVGVSGDSVLVGAPFDTNSNGLQAGAVYSFAVDPLVVDPPGLTFDLDVAGSVTEVAVAPTGIAANRFNRSLVESENSGTVAASSISSIELAETSLAAVPIGATPLSAIVLDSVPLSAIPLVQIDVDGGWADIIAGTALEGEPFSTLTFRDALRDPIVGGTVAALPLSAIDVSGTPLSAIPLSAIALGATPLSAIPLSAIDQGDNASPWCALIADLIPPNADCAAALAELSLMEVTLRGVPLSAIPLSAIPLSAIDLAEAPLSAIPLSAIELQGTPLSAIPLSAIPLQGTPLSAIPLSAIPLSAIPLSAIPLSAIELQGTPLSAIPLSAIPLSAIPTSIPLSAIPLSAIEVDGTPLSAIQVQGAPLSAIPLSAILLADTPLSAIPLSAIGGATTDWCAVLAGTGYDCTNGVDPTTTTLRELSVRGVPLSAIPLSAIPLSAIPLSAIGPAAAPLSAIPLSAIPLSAIPLSAIPLSAIELQGTPVSAIPLSAIDVAGSPLSAIPLSAIPLSAIGPTATPLSAIPLSAIPLSAIPLSAIPLSAIGLENTPLSAIDVLATPLSAIPLSAIPLSAIDCSRVACNTATLGDAIRRGAADLSAIPLSAIQSATSGIRLGDIADAFATFDRTALRAAVDGSQRTLGQLQGVDDLTIGDLPSEVVADATLGQLSAALSTVTFADLVSALDDAAAGETIRQAIDGRSETLGQLDSLGDITLGDLMAEDGPQLDLADIAPVLGFITVQSIITATGAQVGAVQGTLDGLTPEQLGQLTLADLVETAQYQGIPLGELLEQLGLAGALAGFTLADLLIALIDPSSQAFGGFRFEQVDVAALPSGTVAGVGFRADFTLSGSRARTIEVHVALPSTAGYVRGSSTISLGGGTGDPIADPSIDGNVLTWTVLAQPGQSYTIDFEVLPAVRLGATSLAATAVVVGTDVRGTGSASIQVVEGLEPNDYPETTPASDDTIYLTYISTPTDIDVFELTVRENDRLLVELSNLDADLDVVLYAKYSNTLTGTPLSRVGDQPPLIPITDPDAEGTDSEPLDDFPRLDLLYPADGLELLQVANRSGTANETLSTGRLPAGTYYIQVHGANGAVNVSPASLQLKVIEAEARPECTVLGPLPSATPGQAPALAGLTGNTLFLVSEMRLEQLHGAAGRSLVTASLDALTAYLEANPALGIDPIVVPVDGFQAVRDAYDGWDDPVDACDPTSANAVVGAINTTIVDPLRDQLDHVVIVGGDEIIPMARLIDRTTVANEYDFRHEFDGRLVGGDGVNAFTGSFWAGTFLSDEPYGEAAARSLGDRHLYVTDVALGRLVETPAEIADALDNFVVFEGQLDVNTATVLGYDFLSDGSREIADTLSGALGASNVDDELAEGRTATGGPWDRLAAQQKLEEAATNALVSLNAHFDHYRALPAIGDKVPNFDDNVVAADVRLLLGDDALAQSLVFSMGCHSGLSVSDVLIGSTNADWAQTMGQLGALYVGNTGFGYGDTVRVAYTEELMALFAEEVTRPLDLDGTGVATTVGQALAYAKNRYVAENSVFSVYDEKAIMESTFYGLPFYRVGLTPVSPPPVPSNVTTLDVTDTPSLRTSVTATNTPVTTERGTYYANVVDGTEQAIVAPGRPIQPKLSTDVSVVDLDDTTSLSEVATGAIVLGMESRWVPLVDPVVAAPVFDLAEGAPEPDLDPDLVFPARPVTINTVSEPGGERQRLVVATGQYRAAEAIQRLDDRLDLVVYYRDPDQADVLPPTIRQVDSTLVDGFLTVQVTADDLGGGVDRVYVLVAEDPGNTAVTWRGVDLTFVNGRWVGSLALAIGTTDVEFIVQAKDTVGNVGYATNKARNFLTSATPAAPAPPATALTATVTTSPSASGWFDGEVTIAVTSSAAATYSIDGAAPVPIPLDGTFTIVGDGVRTWTVSTSTGWSTSGTVRIDTTAPTVSVGSPVDGATYLPGRGVVDVTCSDLSLASCDVTIDDEPVEIGDPLPTAPGTYTLSVTAIDALDRSASLSSTFTIEADDDPPVLGAATWPTTPQLVGTEVVVTVPFTDATMPDDAHTATVDWGDGTVSSLFVRRNSVGGEVTGRHTYPTNGVYPVVVTITDASGNTSTVLDAEQQRVPIGYVVVYDTSAGRVSGSGTFWVESDLYGPRGTGRGTDVHFGYHARYKNVSSTVPDGRLSMHRKNEFRFESTAYDYLVINDSIAVAEGTGKLNRADGYRFRVQGADLGSSSYFQVTIWDTSTNEVVYDNGVLFDDDSTEVLLGGIRIRT